MRHSFRRVVELQVCVLQTARIAAISVIMFMITDLVLTALIRTRGFSQFFESSREAGFINKRNFSGRFGGPLDNFSANVDIDKIGTRKLFSGGCNSKSMRDNRLIIVGDSMTAGFEVENHQTYSSIFSQLNCNRIQVINGGVRAHDTHMAIANALRITKEIGPIDDRAVAAILYMATSNDFWENENKNAYYSLKSKFGSIYDGEYRAPSRVQWFNNARMLIGDRMYMTTKVVAYFEILRAIKNDRDFLEDRSLQSKDTCIRKSTRLLEIYQSTISQASERRNDIFLLGVHPSTIDFAKSERLENCLKEVIESKKTGKKIKLVMLHKYIRAARPGFINNPLNRFKRDGHYSTVGHKNIAYFLNSLVGLPYSR